MKKKIPVYSELIYIIGLVVLSFSVAMTAAADFGVSMIVAPAYVFSLKFDFLTFGQSEYVLQAVLFVIMCIILKKIKPVFLISFVTCIIYGGILDLWRTVIPVFNPQITPPGSMSFPVRIVFLIMGMLLTAISVAMLFRTYIYPQVYDFFVKAVSDSKKIDRTKFKRKFDGCCFVLACVMTLVFFRKFVGVGWGTVIMTLFNGILIGKAGQLFDYIFEIKFLFPKLEEKFRI